MAKLAGRLNWLTGVYVGLTAALLFCGGVQLWLAVKTVPQPIVIPAPVVNVPAPVVQILTPPPAAKPAPKPKK
jgi:hypothetical protein